MKRVFSVLLAMVLVFGISTSVFAAKEQFTVVSEVTVTEVASPVTDTEPLYSAKTTTNYCKIADVNNATWKNGVVCFEKTAPDQSGRQMQVGEKFKAGYYYMVRVSVDTTTSFKMEAGGRYADVKGTVNGHAATVYGISNDNVSVDYVFPNACQKTLTTIALTVPAPADGAKPSFDKISGEGFYSDNASNPVAIYKNGIAWYKTASSYIAPGTVETFRAGTEYTVKISLITENIAVFSTSLKATVNGKAATVERFGNGQVTISAVLTAPAKSHTHTPSDWKFDDVEHWRICTDSVCGAIVSEKQVHVNSDGDGKCDACGYLLPIKSPENNDGTVVPETSSQRTEAPETSESVDVTSKEAPEEETEKTVTTTSKNSAETKGEDGKNSTWIIVCAALMLGVAAVAAFFIVKNNKKAN